MKEPLSKKAAVEELYDQRMSLARMLAIKAEEEEELHASIRVNTAILYSLSGEEPPSPRTMIMRTPAGQN